MSRSGYIDDYEGDNLWGFIMYRGAVTSALRGKRGQRFLRDLIDALDAMPVKRLVAGNLQEPDPVCAAATYQAGLEPALAPCAMGAVGQKRGVDMSWFDPEVADDDPLWVAGKLAEHFDVAEALAREVQYENDECTVGRRVPDPKAYGGFRWAETTPEDRWAYMRRWAEIRLKKQEAADG